VRIGLISDTHGLLRPEALAALAGADHIIHAGDIGTPEVLEALGRIAPLTAVRGNNDRAGWARGIAQTETVRFGEALVYVIHDLALLDIDPQAEGIHAVVAGHSHKPSTRVEDEVLYVNPGSAGPRRFTLPVSVGHLHVEGARVRAELITLEVRK
jgi:putative phosphoesterase